MVFSVSALLLNSNLYFKVSLSVIPAVEIPALFHIGVFTITYRAQDLGGLTSDCNFTVTVIGMLMVLTKPVRGFDNVGQGFSDRDRA